MHYTELIAVNKKIIIGITVAIITTIFTYNQSLEITSEESSSQKNLSHEKTSIRAKYGNMI